MTSANEKSFLGTGWSFPPTFGKGHRGVKMTSDADDIEASLNILLSTRPGERVMNPGYGCNLDVLLFEAINTSLVTYVKDLVSTAILKFEPRIKLENCTISTRQQTEGKLLISLDYTIRTTNARHNYVYPFYLNEGTNIA